MKKIILLTSCILISFAAHPQDATFNNLTSNTLIKSGGSLDFSGWGLKGDNTFDPRPNFNGGLAYVINNHNGLTFSAHTNYGGIRFYNQGYPNNPLDPATGAVMVMCVTNNGVGIGVTDPQGYKLAVNGNMVATTIAVKTYANWPDYVFSKAYTLPSLKDTKKFIDQNGHLPDIPTAAEISSKGIDLGDMNAKLLKKIEELTLHLIRLEEQNEQQQKALERLQSIQK
jgi:hypothetical protein